MDLKHISAFIATFEEGSINRAAMRLGAPQPSVSVLVRDLEAELKTPLFDRQARGAKPTEAARTIYPLFQRVLADLETARLHASGQLQEASGPLRAGMGTAVIRGFFPSVLLEFMKLFPGVQVRLAEGFTGRLTEWTLAGDLDFAVVALPPRDRRVIGRRLSLEPILMISSGKSGREHLSIANLRGERDLKVVLPWSQNSIRQVVDRFIESGQIPAARVLEIDSIPTILDFVEATDWVTFLPFTAVTQDLHSGRYCIQRLLDPEVMSEFYLIYPARSALSAAAKAFIACLEGAFEQSAHRWKQAFGVEGEASASPPLSGSE